MKIKKLTLKELNDIFAPLDFHRHIKPLIVADFKAELKKKGIENPDLYLDKNSKIYLVHPNNIRNYVETGLSIKEYKA